MATVKKAKEDVSTLPVWARQRIEKLEADVEHYKREATAVASCSTDTNVFLDRGMKLDPSTGRYNPDHPGLPPNAEIGFRLPNFPPGREGALLIKHDVDHIGHPLGDVEVYWPGSYGRLVIVPVMGNVIRLRVAR